MKNGLCSDQSGEISTSASLTAELFALEYGLGGVVGPDQVQPPSSTIIAILMQIREG